MELSTRVKHEQFIELTISHDGTSITIDLSDFKSKKWLVPNDLIEKFVGVANDCSRFNGISDLDFVYTIFNAFLNDSEREEFIQRIAKHTETLDQIQNGK